MGFEKWGGNWVKSLTVMENREKAYALMETGVKTCNTDGHEDVTSEHTCLDAFYYLQRQPPNKRLNLNLVLPTRRLVMDSHGWSRGVPKGCSMLISGDHAPHWNRHPNPNPVNRVDDGGDMRLICAKSD